MYILGIYMGHNATASLMKDGTIIACASEERFNHIKNFTGFPKNAIAYVLKEGNIDSSKLDLVAFPLENRSPIHAIGAVKKDFLVSIFVLLYAPVNLIRLFWGMLIFYFPVIRPFGRLLHLLLVKTVGAYTNAKEKAYIANYLGIERERIVSFDHHLSHAASGYYASPFNKEKALVVTLDGEGDTYSGSVSLFEGAKYRVLSRIPRESSVGYMYLLLTKFLGMRPGEDEYKVMGLAPYAKELDVDTLYRNIKKLIQVDREKLTFKSTFNTQDTNTYLTKKMMYVRFDILAGVFQRLLEEKITKLIEAAIQKTGIKKVVLAGGVFMNVKVNQKISELDNLNELFLIPSCGDESSTLGASYLAYNKFCQSKQIKITIDPIKDIYWGPKYSNQEIEEHVEELKKENKYTVKKVKEIEVEVARLLSQRKVVARLSSRMEFGARALGNRSILADPRNVEMIRTINESIKSRDFWMPFAPTILFERMHDYIKNSKRLKSPYMMLTFDTTELGRKDLKAAMHQYDFTVRPQLLEEEYNPKYYRIIKEFEKLTGVAGVLNTSFNIHGYPIVLGPKEAIFTFKHSGLQYLALEDYLISKKKDNEMK